MYRQSITAREWVQVWVFRCRSLREIAQAQHDSGRVAALDDALAELHELLDRLYFHI